MLLSMLFKDLQDRRTLEDEAEPVAYPWDLIEAVKTWGYRMEEGMHYHYVNPTGFMDAMKKVDWQFYDGSEYGDDRIKVGDFLVNKGLVFVEPGVVIGDFVKFTGVSWIGRNTIIGDRVTISSSYIGRECVVGEDSKVRRSVVGDRSRFYHYAFIADSVVGYDVKSGGPLLIVNRTASENRTAYYPVADGPPGCFDYTECPSSYGCCIDSNVTIGSWVSMMPGSYLAEKESVVLPSLVYGNNKIRRYVGKDVIVD